MVPSHKQKFQWPSEAEKKLIEVWYEVLARLQGHMIMKKAKRWKVANLLNPNVQKEFNLPPYSEAEALSKVNNLASKARRFYESRRRMERERMEFQDQISQRNQLFQAELLKRLFQDKTITMY